MTQAQFRISPFYDNDKLTFVCTAETVASSDPGQEGYFFAKGITCTGVLVRCTEKHPHDLGREIWWTRSAAYLRGMMLRHAKLCPDDESKRWTAYGAHSDGRRLRLVTYTSSGDPTRPRSFKVSQTAVPLRSVKVAPFPFNQGSMRLAFFMELEFENKTTKRSPAPR